METVGTVLETGLFRLISQRLTSPEHEASKMRRWTENGEIWGKRVGLNGCSWQGSPVSPSHAFALNTRPALKIGRDRDPEPRIEIYRLFSI